MYIQERVKYRMENPKNKIITLSMTSLPGYIEKVKNKLPDNTKIIKEDVENDYLEIKINDKYIEYIVDIEELNSVEKLDFKS